MSENLGLEIWHERMKVLLEVSRWGSKKRDGIIRVPLTLYRQEADAWRSGYYEAMNEVSQHFNMEYLEAKKEDY